LQNQLPGFGPLGISLNLGHVAASRIVIPITPTCTDAVLLAPHRVHGGIGRSNETLPATKQLPKNVFGHRAHSRMSNAPRTSPEGRRRPSDCCNIVS
jgi:hypothetical protein